MYGNNIQQLSLLHKSYIGLFAASFVAKDIEYYRIC